MTENLYKTIYRVEQMDCPSEEQMIRMKFSDLPSVRHLVFDIPARTLEVIHENDEPLITQKLSELRLGSSLVKSEMHSEAPEHGSDSRQRKALLWVLGINLAFFIIEITTGLLGRSMGLVADSLDMLADSIVYGLALIAVGGTALRKKNIARGAGYIQLLLAFLGLAEVIRRFLGSETVPDFKIMIVVSFLALIANAACLFILQGSRSSEAYMKASMIFTSNDIIINAGVIVAGFLVLATASRIPDLIVGSIVFLIVVRGAYRILQLGK